MLCAGRVPGRQVVAWGSQVPLSSLLPHDVFGSLTGGAANRSQACLMLPVWLVAACVDPFGTHVRAQLGREDRWRRPPADAPIEGDVSRATLSQ